MWGTTIFSRGSPGVNTVDSPLVTSSPSGAIVALRIRNLISLCMSPLLAVGVFPDIRCDRAARQLSLRSCAAFQAARLKKDASCFIVAHLVAGSITVSDISLINLCIEQVSALQVEGCRLWWSEIEFRLYFPLKCLTEIGILFIFVRKRFILEEAENFPCFMSWIACWTGRLSGRIIIGNLDSLRRLYSD